MRLKKLVIVSHTDHQYDVDGVLKGWGPTVNEINYLSQHWEEVVHVGCLYNGNPKGSSMPYNNLNIQFMPIPPFGGKTLKEKLGILIKAPQIIRTVRKAIRGASHVQLRVPMGIGLFLIPWFALRSKKKYHFWIKYANNWGEPKPPLGFGLQRWMLKKNIADCFVTMNGFWPQQEPHCISFENPCLTSDDLRLGEKIRSEKNFEAPYRLVFIGRIESEKGAGRLLDALEHIPAHLIDQVTFIGEGPLLDSCIKKASALPHSIHFTGSISQNEVHRYLHSSHFLILPTLASEGFPKVLAEATCFGCIPVCTEIASVSHYIQNLSNGIILSQSDVKLHLHERITQTLNFSANKLKSISDKGADMAALFTFEAYYNKLQHKIFR